jgi:hypothetical protein
MRRNPSFMSLFRFLGAAFCVILFNGIVGCNSPDAPWCLMRAGDWSTDTMTWESPDNIALTFYDHLEVECLSHASNQVELVWSGPLNLLDHASAVWIGNELVIDHEDRCQWTRDLSHVVHVKISAPHFDEVELNGQGSFKLNHVDSSGYLTVDARDYAGTIDLHVVLDSATVKLQNGAVQAIISGEAHTFEGYSSGLSSLDASACEADYAYIHQAGISGLRFMSRAYAYVRIDAPGNVFGGIDPPVDWELNRTGSGQLHWQH